MPFHKSWWRSGRRKSSRKGLFGGTIASQDQIEALSDRIEAHKAVEDAAAEQELEQMLNQL